MPLSAGPYYFVMFGTLPTKIPLAISPVERYVAPDTLSSWTAVGIHGYVLRYNEYLDRINEFIGGSYQAAHSLENPHASDTKQVLQDTMNRYMGWGIEECKKYVDYLAATQDSLVAGCAQLKVPPPRHGSTAGMKPVYTLTMTLPPGSWAVT